jgi:hypothetical protein
MYIDSLISLTSFNFQLQFWSVIDPLSFFQSFLCHTKHVNFIIGFQSPATVPLVGGFKFGGDEIYAVWH